MRMMSVALAFVLSSSPALAQQPIHESVARAAARIAAAQAEPAGHVSKSFWSGAVIAAAGSTVAILGATAFKSEDTTSGNTPPGAFAQCEALKTNPVYAGNQCDVLKGPNLPIVWSGVAAAVLGGTLMAIGAAHGSVEFGPRRLTISNRFRF